jgi:hypothetical protein
LRLAGTLSDLPLAVRSLRAYSDSRDVLVWVAVVAGSLTIGAIHVLLWGNVFLTLAVLASFGIFALSIFRPRISYYIFVALAMSISQWANSWSWTYSLPYHWNLNVIHRGLQGLPLTPLEVHLLLIICGLLLHRLLFEQKTHYVISWQPMLLYVGYIVFAVIHGQSRGGDFLPALWELRGVFYLVFITLLTPQLIHTEQQVKVVIWVLIGSLFFRATEVNYLYMDNGFSPGEAGWGDHEDAGFFTSLLIFTPALMLFKADRAQRKFLLYSYPYFVMAFIAGDRRTVYAVLAVSAIIFVLMMDQQYRRRVGAWVWKIGLVFAVYLVVFWNSTNSLAGPAQQIKSALAEDEAAAGESYSSNLYRKAEDYNLSLMIRQNLILGTGYGIQIDYSPVPMPIFWDLGFYIPHNQMYGLAAKAGIIGFCLFWFFYLSVFFEVSTGVKIVQSPYARAVLVLVSAALVNHLVYSYFDIMLTYFRNNVYLGTLLGVASAILGTARAETANREREHKSSAKRNAEENWILGREQPAGHSTS